MCCLLCRMEKRGLVGKIVLWVIVVILLVVVVGGIYFYNFYVFKTVRICVGEGVDTEYACANVQDCIDAADVAGIDVESFDLDNMPTFLNDTLQEVLDEIVYCDVTCFVKDVRGINPETQEIEMLESCESGETEIVVEIRGKEGLEILKYLKNLEE